MLISYIVFLFTSPLVHFYSIKTYVIAILICTTPKTSLEFAIGEMRWPIIGCQLCGTLTAFRLVTLPP